MTLAEISAYWWLLPLLLMLACCFFCGRGCRCGFRGRSHDKTAQHPARHS